MSARARQLRQCQNEGLESGFDQVLPVVCVRKWLSLCGPRLMAAASAVPEAGSGVMILQGMHCITRLLYRLMFTTSTLLLSVAVIWICLVLPSALDQTQLATLFAEGYICYQ